ncbi:MAG TPA: DUF2244 domain-containing protein [Usitatibacter sp.]|nr:DUF2244 domain-containing protein [Usitatibacter sp.]
MAPVADSLTFVHLTKPNRSLGVGAQRVVLAMIAATTLGVAGGATAFGAWPVMPFAGLEVALVALAFRVLRKHDADFERFEIGEHEVRVEARDARHTTCFVANRPWARVVLRERGARCTLGLAYAGRTVPLGRMLSDEGRRQLAESIRGRLPITAN